MNHKRKTVLFAVALSCALIVGFIGRKVYLYCENHVPSQIAAEDCPLHNRTNNAPLIVDTSTGMISELNLEPSVMPREDGKYGVFFMGTFEGGSYAVFPDDYYASVNISPSDLHDYSHRKAGKFFCDDCLASLEKVDPKSNFVLGHVGTGSFVALPLLGQGARWENFTIFIP